MKISVLFFGITTDLVKASQFSTEVEENSSIANLKTFLKAEFPQLENIDSYAIAVNEEYAGDEKVLKEDDVVAVIPPVSGG
jgi:molybdopterin converting factor subunit 1